MMEPRELLIMEALSGGRGGGTSDYTALRNLPTINGEPVTGDLSGADLHLATLDSSGLVPAENLPSYVDDVLEYDSALDFPAEGETGKIYLAKNTSTQYRWSGTQYVVITRYVPPATNAPQMDGTAAVGSAEAYAREDHVHPTDTSRASTAVATTSTNGLMSGADKAKLDGVSFPVVLSNQSIASFTSAAAGRPLRVTVNIVPQQSGSGDPSPSNVRTITGWTGANVYVSPTTTAADGTVYNITFPSSAGTVYGGTLDVRGLLIVTHASALIKDLAWIDASVRYNTTSLRGLISTQGSHDDISCDIAKGSMVPVANPSSGENYTIAKYIDSSVMMVARGYASVAEFKTALGDYKIVYPLATPVTYQLAPQQLVTLVGTNNVFADCGPVTVTHWPGTGTPVEPVDMEADVTEAIVRAGFEARLAALENA